MSQQKKSKMSPEDFFQGFIGDLQKEEGETWNDALNRRARVEQAKLDAILGSSSPTHHFTPPPTPVKRKVPRSVVVIREGARSSSPCKPRPSSPTGFAPDGSFMAPPLKKSKSRIKEMIEMEDSQILDVDEEDDDEQQGQDEEVERKQEEEYIFEKDVNSVAAETEHNWQKAMEITMSIFVPLKVDGKGLTLLPDQTTIDCFKKAVNAWLKQEAKFINYTFTNSKTFTTIIARCLLSFVVKSSGMGSQDANPSGIMLWQHGCAGGTLHCLHGSVMISKEQVIEMDVTSENGQRALKQQPEKTRIVQNKWGKQVAQVRNCDAMCCPNDAGCAGNNFSVTSCGTFYTDGAKTLEAFLQITEYQQACYPKMGNRAKNYTLLPVNCECNYGNSVPMLGRQIPKVTAFSLNNTMSIDKKSIDDKKLLASLEHPVVLVFQCCNPVHKSSRTSTGKNCDFKISAPDLISAIQLAKQMWTKLTRLPAPNKFPEFKWKREYQVQTTILPQDQDDDDDCLF